MAAALSACAAQLRAEIAAAKMTVADVVVASGISRASMDRYLGGERDIPYTKLAKIGRAIGVPAKTIVARAEERLPPLPMG